MHRNIAFIVLGMILCCCNIVGATDFPNFELKALLESALKQNPDLKATYHRWQASRAAIIHKTALPDPQVNFRHNIEPVQTRTGEQNQVLTISQMLPFPGKQTAAITLNRHMAELQKIQYEISLRNLISEIKKTYAETVFLTAAVRLTRQQQQLVESINNHITANQEESVLLPTLRAQSQLAQSTNDLIRFSELLSINKAKLKALSGLETLSEIQFEKLPDHQVVESENSLLEMTIKNRLEVLAAKTGQRAAETSFRLARFENLPDFTLGFSQSFTGSRPDLNGANLKGEGTDALGVYMQINLPIWQKKKQSRMREAGHKKLEAKARLSAEVENAKAKFSELWFNLANRRRLVQIYRQTIVPQAKQALDSATSIYLNDQSKFADYLESANTFFSLQIAAYRAEADLFISATDLESFSSHTFELAWTGNEP